MKFEYPKADIEKVARENSYTINNVEKILRLSFILNDLNTLPDFKGKLLLKGGTAINLVAFEELPRLSVDLDLNFALNLSKDEMIEQRESINRALDSYCFENGYTKTTRKSFTLDSLSLLYTTTTGSRDKIKLDINYYNRCHIFDSVETNIPYPFSMKESSLSVAQWLSLNYLQARSRHSMRDANQEIFTTYTVLPNPEYCQLRKSVIF